MIKNNTKRINQTETVTKKYLKAKEFVIENGYGVEINWQSNIDINNVTESTFLKETAWVILSCGMRESVIRNKYPLIAETFNNFRSANDIIKNKRQYLSKSKKIFNHKGKLLAITTLAKEIKKLGYTEFKDRILSEGVNYLMNFPYLGPATSYHLAKNIGLNVVKPDRHLKRVAKVTGFDSPHHLCESISKNVGDKVAVVDLVIWRFATMSSTYEEYFSPT